MILSEFGIENVPTSAVTGDIAVSPINATAITGFNLILDLSGEYYTSSQVVGKAFAANNAAPTPALLNIAVLDMMAAYADAAGRPNSDAARINLGGGTLGGAFGGVGAKLTPGVYTFTTGITIASTIYFEGTGTGLGQEGADVFIIQSSGNLSQTANTQVILSNGARAENIFWQIAGNVMLFAGAHMEGILLVANDVTFVTSSSLNGRVLAQTACDLQMATIVQPA